MNIAYVLVQSTIGHEMEVLRDLLKFDIVKEAKGTFGYYDILVKIEAASEKEIEKIITKKITPENIVRLHSPTKFALLLGDLVLIADFRVLALNMSLVFRLYVRFIQGCQFEYLPKNKFENAITAATFLYIHVD